MGSWFWLQQVSSGTGDGGEGRGYKCKQVYLIIGEIRFFSISTEKIFSISLEKNGQGCLEEDGLGWVALEELDKVALKGMDDN